MATMVEVAKRAHVSIATVSGVLNGSRYVSPQLRDRVLKAVSEMDYTINQVARNLQSSSTNMIGMLVPDISDPFHAGVVRVVEDALKTAGYSLLLGNLRDRPEEQSRYLQIMRAQQVDGLLLYMVPGCEDDVRKLIEGNRPVVLMGRLPHSFRADLVGIDHLTGSHMAVEHLAGRGHRRIGIIPGPERQPFTHARVEGWRAALENAGLPADERYISYGNYTVDGGQIAISRLLDLPDPPSAVLAGNFHEVVGVLRILRQRKTRPEQLEVMASHDSEILDAFDPPISSVDQPVHEIGAKAAEMMLRRIRQPGRPPETLLLRPTLDQNHTQPYLMKLQNQVAIVTGSARGIGNAIAARLANEGALLVVADINESDACRAATEFRKGGHTAEAIPVDVTSPERVRKMIETTVATFGRLDILVNNAGVGLNRPFLETSVEDWERVIRINLTGTFLCSQAAAAAMSSQGAGVIVNIASISGERGAQNRSAYGASKAGVIQLTKVMALELASKGIRVNAVAPGPVATEMTSVTHSEAIRRTYCSRIPLKRYAQCGEIAAAVAFLASADASFISGHTLNVDGGFVSSGLMFDAEPQ